MKQLLQLLAVPAVLAAGALLKAGTSGTLLVHVEGLQSGTNFTYTVLNDELVGSPEYVNVWHLTVNAPFVVAATPRSWDYLTDNASYVDWFSTDTDEPYSNDVPPGGALGGFSSRVWLPPLKACSMS